MSLATELNEQYATKPTRYYENARNELLDYIPDEVKFVLDVGCGSGNFGRLLKHEKQCVVWGVEPSLNSAKEAESNLDKVINSGFSGDLPELQGQQFDAIFFNDVLEHLVNPEDVLKEAKKYLKKDGRIIASIPNILFYPVMYKILREQDWQYEQMGILDNTHLRFYTKKSMVRMFEDCGFRVSKIEGINSFVTKRYQLANFLMLNHLDDWKYQQFVVVGQL